MSVQDSIIPQNYAGDGESIKISNNIISVDSDFIGEQVAIPLAEHEIEIIELQANAELTPFDHSGLISDTFSDATGYFNSVALIQTPNYTFEDSAWGSADHIDETSKIMGANSLKLVCSSSTDEQESSAFTAINFKSFGFYLYSAGIHSDMNYWLKVMDGATPKLELGFNKTTHNFIYKIGGGSDVNISDGTFSINTYYYIIAEISPISGLMDIHIYSCATKDGTYTLYKSVEDITIDAFQGTKIKCGQNATNGTTYTDNITFSDKNFISSFHNPYELTVKGTTATFDTNKYKRASETEKIVIELSTFTGLPATITATELIVRDADRESGDSITYTLIDSDSNTDASLALNVKNSFVNIDGSKIQAGYLEINLIPKEESPTAGKPAVKTFCLKVWE